MSLDIKGRRAEALIPTDEKIWRNDRFDI